MGKKYEVKCTDCGTKWKVESFAKLVGPCKFCGGSGRGSLNNVAHDVLRWTFTDLSDEEAYFEWWKKRRRDKTSV